MWQRLNTFVFSAYIRWLKDVRLLVQQELGNPSFSELNRELGYRWRNIDENTKGWYTWLAEKDNVEYRKAMQIYTNSPRYLHLKEQAKIKKMLENPPKIPPRFTLIHYFQGRLQDRGSAYSAHQNPSPFSYPISNCKPQACNKFAN